ncbi:hypothetical protein [Bacillus sp. FJAT-27445]|nr:hypothetical protein [Bacillus sp. FJAT-27445]
MDRSRKRPVPKARPETMAASQLEPKQATGKKKKGCGCGGHKKRNR